MTARNWQDLTTRDFAALDPERTIALLPVGALEQHGPHLPLGTDALIAAALAAGAARRHTGPALLLNLPALGYGHSVEHTDFPGTISIGLETLLGTWLDIGRSVARAGVRKLILLNAHGGQNALVHMAAVRLRRECGLFVARANYFALGVPPGLFDPSEVTHGLHGGEVETSLMLHLHPESVRRDALADFEGLPQAMARDPAHRLLGPEKPIGFGWLSQDLHPEGVVGNARRADAQRGAQLYDWLVERLVQLVAEVAATPLSTLRQAAC